MPWSGSAPNQTFVRTDGTRTGPQTWQEADAADVHIISSAHDTHDEDLADGIEATLKKDGGNSPSAAIDWNGQRIPNLGAPTTRTDAQRVDKVQDSSHVYAGTSAGTDTITATLSPAITAYVAGQRYHFKAGGTNTGAATINFNSVGAGAIKKGPAGTTALAAGDITTGGIYTVEYDGTNFQLRNPKFPDGFATTDAPQFATIELGAASDTTLSRASAGVLHVEGVALLRANQNLGDVSSAATTFGNIKQAASDTATGVIEIATQAEQVTATDATRAATPGRQMHHPAHPKAWARWTPNSTTILQSYGVSSVSVISSLQTGVNFSTAFANANYGCAGWAKTTGNNGDGVLAGSSDTSFSTTVAQLVNRATGDSGVPTSASALFLGTH